jgi:hypothetical protein
MKSLSLYKYLTIDTLKKVIDGSIRFTQPGAFNDPFEMLPELNVPADYPTKEMKIQFSLTEPRRTPPVGELSSDFKSNYCNDATSRKILQSFNETIGVLCLSRNHDSLLMWSHYADEYSGAVIEFDDKHDFFQGLIDVEYRKNRPIKDISAYITDGQAIPIAELCVKSDQWQHESEVRVVRNLSDCTMISDSKKFPIYVMALPDNCIKSITMGERTPIVEQREIWELVKNTEISLYLAAIANWGYEFRREIIKFNQPFSKMNPAISPRTAHIFTDHPGEIGEIARWTIENNPFKDLVNQTL